MEHPELRIYIARHGQDEDNARDILNGRRDLSLTEIGKKQAEDLASHIKESGLRFDAIYASPLRRAFDTARCVAHMIGGLEPVVFDDLIERDFGIMTGEPISSIPARCASNIITTDTITYFLDPLGAETFPDLMRRARKVIIEVGRRHPAGGAILLVTHGDIGKMIYAEYYGIPWRDVLTQFHFGNSDLILCEPSSPPEAAHVFKNTQHNH